MVFLRVYHKPFRDAETYYVFRCDADRPRPTRETAWSIAMNFDYPWHYPREGSQ